MIRTAIAVLPLIAAGCGRQEGGSTPFADRVVEFSPTASGGFGSEGMPGVVLGPPEGGGESTGSTDVVSLGCRGSIVLEVSDPPIVDGPGADFIVFENAFVPAGGSEPFVEPGEVSASADGVEWRIFECLLAGETPAGCAGVSPVYASTASGIDATDPDVAGGDAFDLARVGLGEARFVRIVDRTEEWYGSTLWCTPPTGGFDLDALSIVDRL